MIAAIITPTNNKKSHAVVLSTYFLALIIGTITGGFWGVVGHMMETEKTDFATALGYINPIIYGGYFLTGLILIFTLSHIIKKRRSSAKPATSI